MPEADATTTTAAADLALLKDAARSAGEIAMRYFRRSPEVWLKGGTSPVSEADYAVDKFLRDTLIAARPDYGWLSEESADNAERLGRKRTFVVDPIDGTRGFLEHQSQWCVSVAVVEDGVSIAGALECPARDETYWAASGEGAWKNGERIRVRVPSARPEVAGPKALLDEVPRPLSETLRRFRYVPSLAFRIAMIADGALDATFVKPNAHDWDIAAADLILREAGGRIVNAAGRQPRLAGKNVRHGALVAGSGPLLDKLVGVIAREAR